MLIEERASGTSCRHPTPASARAKRAGALPDCRCRWCMHCLMHWVSRSIFVLTDARLCRSKLPVPVVLVNYDGFYSSLMDFLRACDRGGTVGAAELHNVVVAADNEEVGSPKSKHQKQYSLKGKLATGSHMHGMSRVWLISP